MSTDKTGGDEVSEITLAVLRMPDQMFWTDEPLRRAQHNAIRKEAADEIEYLRARIAELEWQPIETAPKDGTGVLGYMLYDNGHWVIDSCWFSGGCWRMIDFVANKDTPIEITHWMPIPAAPQREGGV